MNTKYVYAIALGFIPEEEASDLQMTLLADWTADESQRFLTNFPVCHLSPDLTCGFVMRVPEAVWNPEEDLDHYFDTLLSGRVDEVTAFGYMRDTSQCHALNALSRVCHSRGIPFLVEML